ncbi:hypothetical protein PsorP6_008630 [Peronosclerospora sorghi]|uniref:Uncharacterized protein n=1 Tax=Peronosclerospora sorghi TaxID=230839 RepID=A0ACC0WB34_9STRA|nr:hypothetical protein PsorP6_008630 [Peronosclerospora sorghi]
MMGSATVADVRRLCARAIFFTVSSNTRPYICILLRQWKLCVLHDHAHEQQRLGLCQSLL